MSNYRRDDKEFKARIAALADAGLRFPTTPGKLAELPLPIRRGHFNLPGLVIGLLAYAAVAAIYSAIVGGTIFGLFMWLRGAQ
jgi:hypothetical protein